MIPSSKAFVILKRSLLEKMFFDIKSPKDIKKWTRSTFKEAAGFISKNIENSAIISEECKQSYGTYISSSTLERLLKYGYELPNPIDKRRLNTLNKICVYLGFKSWTSYCLEAENTAVANQEFYQIIYAGLNAEFEVYYNMPNDNLDKLLPYFIKEGPAFKQIYNVVTRLNNLNWVLSNKNNPSYYEILDIDLLKVETGEIHLITHECWYLKWYNEALNKPEKYFNENNRQLYILKKENDVWKIYLNHYPFKLE